MERNKRGAMRKWKPLFGGRRIGEGSWKGNGALKGGQFRGVINLFEKLGGDCRLLIRCFIMHWFLRVKVVQLVISHVIIDKWTVFYADIGACLRKSGAPSRRTGAGNYLKIDFEI